MPLTSGIARTERKLIIMIHRTQSEIEKFIHNLWPEVFVSGFDSRDVTLQVTVKPNEVQLELSRMYDYIELQFEHLLKISKFFGTKNIADADRSHYSGCETCDYGSKYSFTLNIRRNKKGS